MPILEEGVLFQFLGFLNGKKMAILNARIAAVLETISIAGIWKQWKGNDESEIVNSFSLLTTRSNHQMLEIHTRMPVFISEERGIEWLDPDNNETDEIKSVYLNSVDPELEVKEISTLVNSPKDNRPEVLETVKSP